MKKIAATLLATIASTMLYAEVPQNSTGQQSCYINRENGAWTTTAIAHEKEVLPDGSTQFSYSLPFSVGSITENTIYDQNGNKLKSIYNRNSRVYKYDTLTYTYSDDNKLLSMRQGLAQGNHIPQSRSYRASETDYIYGSGGEKVQEIKYEKVRYAFHGEYFDTTTTTYSYDYLGRISQKSAKSTHYSQTEMSNYTYSTAPTGETVITERMSAYNENGQWSSRGIVKKYCSPHDTIVEKYHTENGLPHTRIYNSYTYDGSLLETTEYETESDASGTLSLQRKSRTTYLFDTPSVQ